MNDNQNNVNQNNINQNNVTQNNVNQNSNMKTVSNPSSVTNQNTQQMPNNSQVTTPLPTPQVVVTESENIVKNNESNNTNNNVVSNNMENTTQKKGGNLKYLATFIFLIGIILFVFFLPQISQIVKDKNRSSKNGTQNNLIENGTLICKMDNSTDDTDTYYEFNFLFNDKLLETSELKTQIESVSSEILTDKKTQCDVAANISKNIPGITMECDLTSDILVIREEYVHKDIKKKNLAAYTEAGGTYPEFDYGKNIYDIQSNLTSRGYDCEVTSAQ